MKTKKALKNLAKGLITYGIALPIAIGIKTAPYLTASVAIGGISYLAMGKENIEKHYMIQELAFQKSDLNKDGHLRGKEWSEFINQGGKVCIR